MRNGSSGYGLTEKRLKWETPQMGIIKTLNWETAQVGTAQVGMAQVGMAQMGMA